MRPAAAACTLLSVAGLVGPMALAETADGEPALARSAEDAGLTWNPCPPFLPEGCGIAVLHGDPARENLDVFFRVPAGAHIPWHRHSSAERMVLVAGELRVHYEGQDPAVLRPGTYAYGPADRPHEADCANDAPCILFIAFESPLDAVPVEVMAD
jgi:quercetin dioxygenase-like cupin family protein